MTPRRSPFVIAVWDQPGCPFFGGDTSGGVHCTHPLNVHGCNGKYCPLLTRDTHIEAHGLWGRKGKA